MSSSSGHWRAGQSGRSGGTFTRLVFKGKPTNLQVARRPSGLSPVWFPKTDKIDGLRISRPGSTGGKEEAGVSGKS